MSHGCHAIGCEKAVPPKMLFCLKHWRMTHPRIQKLVWGAYVPGQEKRKDPTVRYIVIQAMAVAWLAWQEKKFTDEQRNEYLTDRIWKWLPRMSDADIGWVVAEIMQGDAEDVTRLRASRAQMKAAAE